MDWFYRRVIRYRKAIMAVFAVMVVISAWMFTKVYVDYDLLNYLPEDSPSTTALEFMEKEFGGDVPKARAMIRNVNQKEAKEYKRKLEQIDGVISVQWVDSMLPLNMPLEMLPDSLVKTYYKDGNALFMITLDEEKQLETVPLMYDVIGEDNLLTGPAVNTVVATVNTVQEVMKITVIAILFLIFVLAITTTSWVEPAVVMIGLGVAVVINAGTNLVFGKISFVTNSAGMILQMAVSLDYSVFLIHRFSECKETADPETAMLNALKLSTSSILSSGLTTVIGFLALAFMKFLIGADLGMALSKGVAISLVTSLIFMPGVILATYKWMEKTQHRDFMPSFRGLGRLVCRVTLPTMIAFVLIIVPSYMASSQNNYLYGASKIYGSDTRIGSDTEKLVEVFGENDNYVLMVPRGDRTSENALIREIEAMPDVSSVLSIEKLMGLALPGEMLPEDLTAQLQSENYDRIVITASVPVDGDKAFALIDEIYTACDRYYPGEYYLAGTGVSTYDLKRVVSGDLVKVNFIAIFSVFLVLLLTMKNLLLPVILVLTIETAIWVNMSITHFTGASMFYIAYLIISSIQLGATVDYAILFTERYKENRLELGIPPRECVVTTISDTAVSILTSATAVSVMGFLLAAFSSQRIIGQIGLLLGRGTICSLLAVLFVLPGFLMFFDKYVLKTFSLKRRQKTEEL